jgi:hypothetical protein
MSQIERLAKEHADVTRRYFLQLSAAGFAALNARRLWAQADESEASSLLADAI